VVNHLLAAIATNTVVAVPVVTPGVPSKINVFANGKNLVNNFVETPDLASLQIEPAKNQATTFDC